MSSRGAVATPGPVIIVFLASFAWPIIVIVGLLFIAEKIKAPATYIGIILTFSAAIATTYLGLPLYFAIGFSVTVIGLFIIALNHKVTDLDSE